MKNTLFLIGAISMLVTLTCSAQNKRSKLTDPDEKSFLVEMIWEDGSKTKDHIHFSNGKMKSTECLKYGFNVPEYSVSDEGTINATMESDKEGTLTWEGKITDGVYSGTYLWKKEGQEDVLVSFEGGQVQR